VGGGVAGFEGEVAVRGERGADGGERGVDLLVGQEDLEGVAGHDDQVELAVPGDGAEVADGPVDVGLSSGCVEHRGGRVEVVQASAVAGLAGAAEQQRPVGSTTEPV
jgi:hypothetical protein